MEQILTPEELNNKFCKIIGIKKALYQVLNLDTGEHKIFTSNVKIPKSWEHYQVVFFDEPRYPDFLNNPINFMILLNIQWFMFGQLANVYTKQSDESFEYNYIQMKIKAMEMCDSFGGGEMLDEYKKEVRKATFDYTRLGDSVVNER